MLRIILFSELIQLHNRCNQIWNKYLMIYFDKLVYEIKRSTVGIICQHIKCRTDHFRMYTYIHHHDDMLLPCKKASPFLQRMAIWFKEDPLQKIRIPSYCWATILARFYTTTTIAIAAMIWKYTLQNGSNSTRFTSWNYTWM